MAFLDYQLDFTAHIWRSFSFVVLHQRFCIQFEIKYLVNMLFIINALRLRGYRTMVASLIK